MDALHTGAWTAKAIEELKKIAEVRLAASTEAEKFTRVPRQNELKLSPDASYVHMCTNNTIEGTEWSTMPDTGSVPLVADMSSDILSRPIDVKRFGVIFAGAQKNLGPSGVTVVIIRKDLVERGNDKIAKILQYRTHAKEKSLYNTPPAFAVYVLGLVVDWVGSQGGAAGIEKINTHKAKLLYDALDGSGYYKCPVEKESQSKMNIVFRVAGGDEAIEKKFAKEAEAAGIDRNQRPSLGRRHARVPLQCRAGAGGGSAGKFHARVRAQERIISPRLRPGLLRSRRKGRPTVQPSNRKRQAWMIVVGVVVTLLAAAVFHAGIAAHTFTSGRG